MRPVDAGARLKIRTIAAAISGMTCSGLIIRRVPPGFVFEARALEIARERSVLRMVDIAPIGDPVRGLVIKRQHVIPREQCPVESAGSGLKLFPRARIGDGGNKPIHRIRVHAGEIEGALDAGFP